MIEFLKAAEIMLRRPLRWACFRNILDINKLLRYSIRGRFRHISLQIWVALIFFQQASVQVVELHQILHILRFDPVAFVLI